MEDLARSDVHTDIGRDISDGYLLLNARLERDCHLWRCVHSTSKTRNVVQDHAIHRVSLIGPRSAAADLEVTG